MKLVFMGSGEFAVPSLETLLASPDHDVLCLFTQPDKRAGRGHAMRPPPTKEIALAHGLDVHQPPKIRAPEGVALVREIAPECIVVVAYGQIIPKSILDLPDKGVINVHASILPRYRGAAPIQWAIARGETRTGVSTMLMDEGLDTGAVLLQEKMSIGAHETSASLSPRLAALGADLLARTLTRWAVGDIAPTPQNDEDATKAPRIRKEDARIDWADPSDTIAWRVRAFDPWPVAHTTLENVPLKIWRAEPADSSETASASRSGSESEPGTILTVDPGGLLIACGGRTALRVTELQVAGKARMDATDFARGRRLRRGDRLGPPPA